VAVFASGNHATRSLVKTGESGDAGITPTCLVRRQRVQTRASGSGRRSSPGFVQIGHEAALRVHFEWLT